ncbi:phage antirepressor KilAC domain-containing protein [Riemerella anatipestifer]|uniref:Phage antirepressor KilAC domain-containing protein n=1 Tax=Riemerella anatipestifer TaxID=34085 RepID=A0AAP3AN93_RIEAN|nr:phage antirepressor KilAC domain-containing protein [Riemerella anatipestifer]MBT0573662.1 phage antirepressor KilAC domain-containing protein [Riemerella anatipestifer]MCU7569222.1 phage antirepressor KilAC domain-containing protein [Riemerella anatipestifer]MCW0491187.1 phage antirepressor KilAC domain-containing protein [Riemerella anatipestifer]MCW0524762.1 phage antirepressor KilAC domain-containing protein [Riemerella anatipestifer]MDR7797756.1 phage antirepressor KilAC domain-contain
MKALIKITEQNGKQTVSARELYEFLGYNKAVWSRWYAKNIENNEFAIENIDYQTFNIMLNGNETKDFALTIDFAKKISMMARTQKGEDARDYFIECEKKLKTTLPTTYKEALLELIKKEEEKEVLLLQNQEQQAQLDAQAPKVLFTEAVMGSKTSCLVGELAKIITQNGYYIGERRLFKYLRENGYLGRKGERYNIPNQKYVEQGIFELKKGTRSGSGGVMHTTITTKVTGKGQVYFVNKFLKRLQTA